MLSSSNKEVVPTLKFFRGFGISNCFVVPTVTGLEKCIMDATKQISYYLNNNNLHDYSAQHQGTDNKVIIRTTLVSENLEYETTTSLYRPETKTGDPRLWISKLKNHANPRDLIALIAHHDSLVAINCSNTDLKKYSASILFRSLRSAHSTENQAATELLEKIQKISSMGFIQTMRPGDTGIGYTLESLLGIPANSATTPDFKGIEIKTKRGNRPSNRTTLFSKTPDWQKSRLKSSLELLNTRGKHSEAKNRLQLYHQISSLKVNSYGLILNIDPNDAIIEQRFKGETTDIMDVLWDINVLDDALRAKHKETFWVSAQVKGERNEKNEMFWYNSIKHTGNIYPDALPILLELGVISLDYTIKETPTGGAKDQGYLFKMATSNLDLLFQQVHEYDLSEYR
ncbi:MvaI/BcnI family restriction endonuclease [Gammaproteobacteria bacterium]|nr:MvaI/BcnI family restriction endonuclease [Gammaproteobacteria bacterium]